MGPSMLPATDYGLLAGKALIAEVGVVGINVGIVSVDVGGRLGRFFFLVGKPFEIEHLRAFPPGDDVVTGYVARDHIAGIDVGRKMMCLHEWHIVGL